MKDTLRYFNFIIQTNRQLMRQYATYESPDELARHNLLTSVA
ncbi:MAG: hypothetical protein PHI11_02715 [Gallionella sp.]|nr:hypothetical protein [Gallionella sp.]